MNTCLFVLFTEVPCKYASIGYDLWLICKEIEEHEQDIEFHLPIAANTITEFANSIRELTRRMARIEGLPLMIKEEPQVSIIIPKYSYKKRTCYVHNPEPFFTRVFNGIY